MAFNGSLKTKFCLRHATGVDRNLLSGMVEINKAPASEEYRFATTNMRLMWGDKSAILSCKRHDGQRRYSYL